MPELSAEQLAARVAIPEEHPDELTAMFRPSCIECGGRIKWVDPAALANLDRQAYLELKKGNGIDVLLAGQLWLCLACDSHGLMGEHGGF